MAVLYLLLYEMRPERRVRDNAPYRAGGPACSEAGYNNSSGLVQNSSVVVKRQLRGSCRYTRRRPVKSEL